MELEQLIELIGAVSESKLTDFQYEENGVKLRLKKENAAVWSGSMGSISAAAGNAAMPGVVQMTAGTVPGALASGMQQASSGAACVAPAGAEAAVISSVQNASGALGDSAQASGIVQASAAAQAVSGTAAALADGKIVKSPLVGVFYAAPSEDAAPYVSVGDTVKKGQILACVEAMKLMNEIESDYDGVVAEILVENGQGVGYGEPLFVIR